MRLRRGQSGTDFVVAFLLWLTPNQGRETDCCGMIPVVTDRG